MNHAIILLAGSGTRINSSIPKQFIEVNDKPLFVYCVETFNFCNEIDDIVLVVSKDFLDQVNASVDKFNLNKVSKVIVGGSTRQDSAFNGVNSLHAADDDIVLIHDAARVFVNERIIIDNIENCKKNHAVITAIKSSDSVALGDQQVSTYLNRDEVNIIQTPQTFTFSLIKKAHLEHRNDIVTDDASLVKLSGVDIHFVNGSKRNFKITTDDDLKLAESLLK